MIKSPIFLGSFKQVFIDKWKYGGNFYYRENMKVKFLLLKYITTKFFQNQVGATAPTVPNLDPSLVVVDNISKKIHDMALLLLHAPLSNVKGSFHVMCVKTMGFCPLPPPTPLL